MKRWLLHIYIGVLAMMAASCSNQELVPDPEVNEQVHITFTLAMNTTSGSRSAWEGNTDGSIGDYYDNLIESNLQVLICDGATKVKVKELFCYRTDEQNVYQFTGSVDSAVLTSGRYKIMVLANCQNIAANITDGALTSLSYTNSEINSIPMWGVETVNLNLEPGASNDLGRIYLLRAMAKVEVALDAGIADGFIIKGVSFNKYNVKGYCLPTGYNGIAGTKDLDTETCFHPFTGEEGSNLEFKKSSDGNWIAYAPEYENKENKLLMHIDITDADGNNLKLTGTDIKFQNYTDNQPFDVIRNHYYTFKITRIAIDTSGNIKTDIVSEVEKWRCIDVGSDYE